MLETLKRIINKKKEQKKKLEEEKEREELARKAMPQVKERIVEFLKCHQDKSFTWDEVAKSLNLYYFNGESLAAIMVFQDFRNNPDNPEHIKWVNWLADWDSHGDSDDEFYYG